MTDETSTASKRTPVLDREDVLYLIGTGCISGGAGSISLGCGLIALGVLLLCWPLMARLLATHRQGSQA